MPIPNLVWLTVEDLWPSCAPSQPTIAVQVSGTQVIYSHNAARYLISTLTMLTTLGDPPGSLSRDINAQGHKFSSALKARGMNPKLCMCEFA